MGRDPLQKREDPPMQQGAQQSHEAVQADHANTLMGQASAILRQSNPQIKAAQTHRITKLWEQRQLVAGRTAVGDPPERPGRDDSKVRVVAPGKMPALGKGGSLASRQAILHSLVHIESWAVDLSWDAVARFGSDPQYALPEAFLDDFVQVANDEASHFQQLQQRLEAVGSSYGALPVHDGLWESAAATAHSLPARLAVESCVHEARGLDRLPHTIQRFRSSGDGESAKLLEKIYQEEVAHCAAGVRWLTYLHVQALTANHGQEHDTKQQLQNVTLAEPCTSSDTSSGSSLRPKQSTDVALDVQHNSKACQPGEQSGSEACSTMAANGMSVTESTQAAATVMQTSCAGLEAHAASEPEAKDSFSQAAKGTSERTALHDWQADAVKYATVEEWFHGLVRAHFKGSLKPPFNEEARAAAGFGPEWYLPLSSVTLR
ncbi:hypothetical protein WJX77_008860 [Trebouxia sp. C0004]